MIIGENVSGESRHKEIEMLESIRVKNVALIDEAEVEFGEGLNILTGETGAGKSILLNSVQLALGAKADKSLIRQGAEYALAELVFSVDEKQKKMLEDMEIPMEEDMLILQRKIYPAKSSCKINGEAVTVKMMQSVAECFIDIHGQREHQSILKTARQEEILDNYGKRELESALREIAALYQEYREEETAIRETAGLGGNYQRELDFAKYELDEIEKANLTAGEDVELEARYQRLLNAQKIKEAVAGTEGILQNESGNGVLQALSLAIRQLKEAQALDASLENEVQQLSDAENILQECGHQLDRYLDRFQIENDDFAYVEERLNLLNHLKDKYGKEIADIMQYQHTLVEKIDKLENFEQTNRELQIKHEKTRTAYFELAAQLHDIRCRVAEKLTEEMETALQELNFEQCVFEIRLDYDETQMRRNGCSNVIFRISLNPGEPIKDLSAVASGGELSRIMLALKSIFADKDETGTLVFDEIDAGISGKTAWKVSEKLAVLRKRHQVICITHLPQIAAMADAHYGIEKTVSNEKTHTTVRRLEQQESIAEIGRLLGTDQLTEAVLQNAREMKDLAEQTKQSQSKNK
jgi:DNA repair protein RecN (Recombination protein N)